MKFYTHTIRRLLGFLLTLSILLGLTLPAMAGTVRAAEDSFATTTPQPNAAEDFEMEGGVITGYVGSDTTVVIPSAIDGVPITGIEEYAFLMTDVITIVLPSTIETIGNDAFSYTTGSDNSITDLYFYGACPENLENAFASAYDFAITVHCKEAYEEAYQTATEEWYSFSAIDVTVLADVTVTEDPSYGGAEGPDEPEPGADDPATTTPEPNPAEDFEVTDGVITGYNGTSKTVVIPDAVDGTPITGIGDGAFTMTGVQVIVIPSTVTEVEDNVFLNTPGPDDDFFVTNTITDLYFYGPCPENLENAFAFSYDDFSLNVHCKSDYEADYTSAVSDWYDYNYVDATVIADVTVTEDPAYSSPEDPDEPEPGADDPATTTPEPNPAEDFEVTGGVIVGYNGTSKTVVIPDAIDGTPITGIGDGAFTMTGVQVIVIPSTVTEVEDNVFLNTPGPDDDFFVTNTITDLYFYGPCPENLGNAFAYSYDDFSLNVHCKSDYEADYTSAVLDWYDYNYVDATVLADVTVTKDPTYGGTPGPDEPDPPVDPDEPDDPDADPNSPCVVVPAANAEEDFLCLTDGEIYAYTGSSPDVVIPGMLGGVTVTKIDSRYGFSKQEVKTIVIPSTVTSIAVKAFTAAGYGGAPFALTDLYFYGPCPNGLASALTASDVTTDLTIHCRAQYKADYVEAVADWGDTVTVLGHVVVTQDPELPQAPDPTVETPEPTDAGEFDFDPAFGLLTKYTGSSAQVTVPATIGGIRVTYFDAQAFSNASDVKKLVIPSTVERLGTGSLRDGVELYFYGACPENLEEAVSDLYDSVWYTIHCKPEYEQEFLNVTENVNGSVDIYPDIDPDLEDPSYGEEPAEYQKPTGGSAADAFSYALMENADGETTAQIVGYVGAGGDITLPTTATVGGKEYPVTAVAESAFNSYNGTEYQDGKVIRDPVALSHISKITVPSTIKTIGAQAFSYVGRYSSAAPEGMLSKLTQIVFEGADVELGNGALSRNVALTSVALPANMTEIPSNMFLSDTALESVVLPKGIISVGAMAFSGCTGLDSVKFQGAVPPEMSIYEPGFTSSSYPFVGCATVLYVPKENVDAYIEAWDEMLNAPAAQAGFLLLAGYDENGSVAAWIPNFAVYEEGHGEDSAEPRYLEYHVTSTDLETKTGTVELAYVGYDGRGLTLNVPQTVRTQVMGEDWIFTVTGIGDYAMQSYVTTGSQGLYWFDEINFPDTLEYIGEGGCWNLAAITDLDLTNTKVHTLGTYAFKACKELRTIELPATLKTMGEGKDSVIVGDEDHQEKIETVENVFAFCDSLERITVDSANPYYKDEDGVLLSKDGKRLIRYPNARDAVHYDIPEGVEVLAQQSFMQSYTGVYDKKSKLETVTFPSTLKKIENLAFRQSNLKSVTLPPNCEFGECIFDINSNLSEVVIPEGVTEIGYYMFWECEKLTQVTFPDSLKKIGDSAFACTGLTELDLNQVEVIDDYAFMRCQGLTELEIAGTANTLGKGVFTSCNNLQKVTFADGCKTVGAYMFTNDKLLKDLTLADSIETIGAGAFTDCWALETVVMPKSLARMGTGVFFDCYEKLKSVIFPDEAPLSALPEGTFESCQGLEYLYLGKNITATGPVSLYDTPVGLWVECSCKEEDFTRNPFDVYGYDLDNNELFAKYQIDEEMGEDAYGNPVYLVWLTELGESSGCSGNNGGTPTEDGLYLAYIAADGAPEFTFGTQTPEEPAVLWVYEQYQDGKTVLRKSYKASELEQLESQGLVGYQFWRMGDNAPITVAATAYVTMDDLLTDANATFATGDTIHVADGSDNYTADLSYATSLSDKYFITDTGAMEVPVVLATCWNSGEGHTQQALEEIAETAYKSSNLRFCYGISQEKYDTQTAHGSRLASNVAQVTVLHPYDMPVDTTELAAAITEAEALNRNEYTSESLNVLDKALEEARKALTAEEQETVDAALKALTDAIAALQESVDTSKLEAAIAEAEARNKDEYTAESYAAVESALAKAKNALTSEDQTLVDAALEALADAIAALQERADTLKLESAIAEAEAKNKDEYTAESYAAVESALSKAKEALTSEDQTLIDAALEALADAIAALEKKPEAPRFDDVADPETFYYDAVNWAVEQGITKGKTDTTFVPMGEVTRGEVVTFLYRALGEPKVEHRQNPFKDVDLSRFYGEAVLWAVETGVTNGITADTFCPERVCTRAQIVTFLYRALGKNQKVDEKQSAFTDLAEGAYYLDAVQWAVASGVAKGITETTFVPGRTCNRGQCVTFLYRAMKNEK